jgi:hypothetical protein
MPVRSLWAAITGRWARQEPPVALYIGEDSEAARLLRTVVEARRQRFLHVATAEEALVAAESFPVRLAVVGRDDQARWKMTLRRLLERRRGLCAILLSNVDDPYLWNEMVQLGGFEVLPLPLNRPALEAVLASAELHFRSAWEG